MPHVAIKVLPEDFASDAGRLARFEREAKLLASLNHPNIATIFGFEETDGVRFIAMELVEGQSLAERIDASGRIEVDEALETARRIALALEAAHEAGVIHRDLKPANVQVAPDGTVKVLDFGIAKVHRPEVSSDLSQSPTAMLPTGTGVIMGTAHYMSPEQARGLPVDKRTDIWSFGCVLYEMLTGRTPFEGATVMDVLTAILEREPDWAAVPKTTSPLIQLLLRQCLEKEPDRRLHDIADARIGIVNTIADPDGGISLAAGSGAAAKLSWRQAIPTPVAAGLGVVAVVTMFLAVWGSMREVSPPSAPTMRLDVTLANQNLYLGLGSTPVLSPNGSHIAFVTGNASTQSELHVRLLAQAESTPLRIGGVYGPFFSPDGQWVGYFDLQEGLQKVSIRGGAPETILSVGETNFPGGQGASWGLDDRIVFAQAGSGLLRIAANGGELESLTQLGEGESHRRPQMLPGGKAILFSSVAADNSSVVEILNLETSARKVVQRGFGGRYIPTGHLVYANQQTLFAAPFDLDELEVVGPAVPIEQGVGVRRQRSTGFSFSNSGTMIYARNTVSRYSVVWVDRNGGTTPLWDDPDLYDSPRLSPDGTRLAVSNENHDVWIYDIQRRVPKRLTFGPPDAYYPAWSPDGEFVVFEQTDGSRSRILRIRADGAGQTEQLFENDNRTIPYSWSADGRFLAYGDFHPETGWDISVLPLEGDDREPFVVVNTDGLDEYAAFSPNGRWLAYDSDQEIYVEPYPPGAGRSQVSINGGTQPRWSMDGRELFYRTDFGIMVVAVNTDGDSFTFGRAEQLFAGAFLGGLDGISRQGAYPDYDVTGDGQRFVMFPDDGQGQTSSGHVTLVTNWFDELKRLVPTDP